MIDIEIQISISERSSGWAINYIFQQLKLHLFVCQSRQGKYIGNLYVKQALNERRRREEEDKVRKSRMGGGRRNLPEI